MPGRTAPQTTLLPRCFSLAMFTVMMFACVLLPGSTGAVLDVSALPAQSPPPEADGSGGEEYVPAAPLHPTAEEAASAVKQAAAHIKEVIQDIPLEQTPLGMGGPAPAPAP